MAIAYLLDTNIISEPMQMKPNEAVLARLKAHQKNLFSASIVLHELIFGLLKMPISKKRDFISDYLVKVVQPSIRFLPYGQDAALWHAQERSRLLALGQSPSFADGQIAAIAHVNNLVLVSRNFKDFNKFNGLKLENWFEP